LVHAFLQDLLSAVYFEANQFGDEWNIKLPGMGLRTGMEEPSSDFGPDIAVARPGMSPATSEARRRAGPVPRPAVALKVTPWRPLRHVSFDLSEPSWSSQGSGHYPLSSRLRSLSTPSSPAIYNPGPSITYEVGACETRFAAESHRSMLKQKFDEIREHAMRSRSSTRFASVLKQKFIGRTRHVDRIHQEPHGRGRHPRLECDQVQYHFLSMAPLSMLRAKNAARRCCWKASNSPHPHDRRSSIYLL